MKYLRLKVTILYLIFIICYLFKFLFCFLFLGAQCIDEFIQSLQHKLDELYETYFPGTEYTHPKIPLTIQQQQQFSSESCYACDLDIKSEDRVQYFNQFSGEFMGAIHVECETNFKIKRKNAYFPIFFHNLSRYDIHLFITKLGDNISVIPCNTELYIALTKTVYKERGNQYRLNFIDSNRFLNSSIEKLASYMDRSNFKVLRNIFPDEDKFNLMCRKGVFPYDYLNDYKVLDETSLPPIDKFFNSLDDSECSIEDYNFALEVWIKFKCNTIRDYMLLYLKSDVLILTDVFENFREICRNIYDLDPVNYVTAPSLSWDAMLRYTKVELELISDANIHNFLKAGIRGGLTQCTQREATSNNKYMKTGYNPNTEDKYISYMDENNLYGWAMSQPLPLSGFKFLSESEFSVIDFYKIPDDGDYGYILEVDLEYPIDLHDEHNSLPFCPENKKPPNGKLNKLIADLNNKHNYVIHLKYLQLSLQHGLKLLKIHRVLRFKQSTWLEPYIRLNTIQRQGAKNEFEKNFYKLMNNAVYGKTMENVEKRRDVKLVTHYDNIHKSKGYRAYICMSNLHDIKIFDPKLCAIELTRLEIMYDKPIYVGATVLELSKWLMYDFYYNFLKQKSDNVKVMYMDTDSFIISTSTDIYNIIKNNPEKFDTSDFDENNQFGIIPQNKKCLGLMKDENAGKILTNFVGLKAKAYSYVVEGDISNTEVKKVKGVKNSVVRKLKFKDYVNCVRNQTILYGEQRVIRSRLHELYTESVNKISLSYKDDKRFLLNKTETLAWGHYGIPK